MSSALDLNPDVPEIDYTHYKTTDLLTEIPVKVVGTFYTAGAVYTMEFTSGLVVTGIVAGDLTSVTLKAYAADLDTIPSSTKFVGVETGTDGIRLPWFHGKITQK